MLAKWEKITLRYNAVNSQEIIDTFGKIECEIDIHLYYDKIVFQDEKNKIEHGGTITLNKNFIIFKTSKYNCPKYKIEIHKEKNDSYAILFGKFDWYGCYFSMAYLPIKKIKLFKIKTFKNKNF